MTLFIYTKMQKFCWNRTFEPTGHLNSAPTTNEATKGQPPGLKCFSGPKGVFATNHGELIDRCSPLMPNPAWLELS